MEIQQLTPKDARRRWFGLLYLILAGGMLIWGLTLLDGVLRGLGFVLYWFACLAFALLAFSLAWLDLRSVRRRQSEQRRALLQCTISSVQTELESARRSTASGRTAAVSDNLDSRYDR